MSNLKKADWSGLSVMKIPFAEISVISQRYTLGDVIFDTSKESFDLDGGIQFDCSLSRKSDVRVQLQGRMQARVRLVCDRCLQDFSVDLDTSVWMIFEVTETGKWPDGEIDLKPEDLDVVMLTEPVIDLVEAARQQVYMELPMQHICHKSCKGLCPQCGVNRNHTACSCEEITSDNPFAVLAALKR